MKQVTMEKDQDETDEPSDSSQLSSIKYERALSSVKPIHRNTKYAGLLRINDSIYHLDFMTSDGFKVRSLDNKTTLFRLYLNMTGRNRLYHTPELLRRQMLREDPDCRGILKKGGFCVCGACKEKVTIYEGGRYRNPEDTQARLYVLVLERWLRHKLLCTKMQNSYHEEIRRTGAQIILLPALWNEIGSRNKSEGGVPTAKKEKEASNSSAGSTSNRANLKKNLEIYDSKSRPKKVKFILGASSCQNNTTVQSDIIDIDSSDDSVDGDEECSSDEAELTKFTKRTRNMEGNLDIHAYPAKRLRKLDGTSRNSESSVPGRRYNAYALSKFKASRRPEVETIIPKISANAYVGISDDERKSSSWSLVSWMFG